MASGYQFAAFLSYSRKDVRLARWLVRSLEEFRLPRQTVEDLKARSAAFIAARPIFRDEHDMPVGGVISDRLSEVLDASATMIVLCTAAAAKSDWVNKEIALFASRHPDRRIIPVVAEGEPDSDETYPPALLKFGKPLAADLRNPAERRQSVVKIAAAVLGLDVDQLVGRVQKHRVEQRRWLAVGGGAAAAVVVGLGVTAGVMANSAKQANDDARATVEVLLTDTREEVQAAGLLSATSAVLAAAEAYFDGKRPGELTDKDLLLKAKLLRQKGADAADRGDIDSALDLCRAAFAAADELLSRNPGDPGRLYEQGQSAYWVGDLHWRRGEHETARTYFEVYLSSAQRLLDVKPDYPGAVLEVGYANANLGQLAVEQFRDPRGAAVLFTAAAEILRPNAADIESKRNLSRLLGYQAQALAQFEDADKVLVLLNVWAPIVEELEGATSGDRSLVHDVARDLTLIGEFQKRRGLLSEGRAYLARALAIAREQLRKDPDNRYWLSFASGLDYKAAADRIGCAQVGRSAESDFGDYVGSRRILSCLRHSDQNNSRTCKKFVDWLGSQQPNFQSEDLWAAILTQCSVDRSISADGELRRELDRVATRLFFSRDSNGLSLWTQLELANFNSAERNRVQVDDLRTDLERRGWNVDQSKY